MAEKHPVFRLTQEAYDQLYEAAMEDPEAYLDPEMDFDAVLQQRGISRYIEDTGVFTDRLIELSPVESGAPNRADRQALDFYHSFDAMTPRLALDERLWAWMTHFRLHAYGLKRWRRVKNANLVNYVKTHWFRDKSTDALWRHNTASRTWWLAHTAIKAAEGSGGAFNAEDAVQAFADTAVFYHLPMYYNFTREPILLGEVVRAILNEAEGIKAEAGLYALLKELNLMGGIQLLAMMPRSDLRQRIVEEVDRIMSDPDLVRDRSKLRNRNVFRSLSLGAGVQSTVLALMAERGEHGLEKPDVAVFADTGWEPPVVYEHLEWLRRQVSFEIVQVSTGNIRENILSGTSPDGNGYLGIPAWLINEDGSNSVAARQCTTKYKIKPINKYLRDRMGIEPGKRAAKEINVEIWMGISVDEIFRVKDSREEWATNRYPLVELELSRSQCLTWFEENYPGRTLPRSACVGCPYKSNVEWKWLLDTDAESFQEAVFIDSALRESPIVKNAITREGATAFLHRSRVPLADIDFSEVEDYDSFIADECEGVCRV